MSAKSKSPRRAVLLVGHGTCSDPRDVPEFLLRIRRGRPAPPELVREIIRRYQEIGGSPLYSYSEALGRALSARLELPCFVAMRFWNPLVKTVLQEIRETGIQELCILPLAPYSVPLYVDVVAEAARELGDPAPELVAVGPYGADPGLVRAHSRKIAPLLSERDPESTELVLTAHSLPKHVIAAGDPYQRQFEEAARAVAHELGWPARIAYQSAGEGGEWLGPLLVEVLSAAHDRGKKTVVVAPVGFLADHIETLYDLDVEAASQAKNRGLIFVRAPALNDDPSLVDALAAILRKTLG